MTILFSMNSPEALNLSELIAAQNLRKLVVNSQRKIPSVSNFFFQEDKHHQNRILSFSNQSGNYAISDARSISKIIIYSLYKVLAFNTALVNPYENLIIPIPILISGK